MGSLFTKEDGAQPREGIQVAFCINRHPESPHSPDNWSPIAAWGTVSRIAFGSGIVVAWTVAE